MPIINVRQRVSVEKKIETTLAAFDMQGHEFLSPA
jgi:hypothetical protein